MQNALGIYSRCPLPLPLNARRPLLTLHYATRRFRSGQPTFKKFTQSQSSIRASPSYAQEHPRKQSAPFRNLEVVERPQLNLSPDNPQEIIDYFKSHVGRWSESSKLKKRLHSFGVPKEDVDPLLRQFVKAVHAGDFSSPQAYDRYNLVRFGLSSEEDLPDDYTDVVMTGILYDWTSDPSHQKSLESVISSSTITSIQKLFEAARIDTPANMFPHARKVRRKVYMHVGPTNSGKTHNALRALAGARTGVYAGPLRLLAHEIWTRLNRGDIVPLGVEQDPAGASPPTTSAIVNADSALDAAPSTSTVKGNPKYARPCNMLTGEEHKIVMDSAPLLSCTVEMLTYSGLYDVAVVDEIQMIASHERGHAWTSAVLGLCAKEIHLCGEETAVPIVEALLKDTEDELVVKRYQRLTPLSIDKPLGGNLRKIQKGDCVVAFSRNRIFDLKKRIEETTGMRCAIVYGKLPSEIRSEQADLFNDPNSGYDVLIGSDAIGMGLNLKIRRVIFETVSKFNGKELEYLSLSQTKQIAGRAGRYGMLKDEKPGGFVTTLKDDDLKFLHEKLGQQPRPLPTARLGPEVDSGHRIAKALRLDAGLEAALSAQIYVSKAPPIYRHSASHLLSDIAMKVGAWGQDLPLEDLHMFVIAPFPWRDRRSLDIIQKLVQTYARTMYVGLRDLLDGTSFMADLEFMEGEMSNQPHAVPRYAIESLESFHRSLAFYAWLAFRKPVSFSDIEEVMALKERVERALHWGLEGLTKSTAKRKAANQARGLVHEQDKIAFTSAYELKKRGHKKPQYTPISEVLAAQKQSLPASLESS
ncbi:hypothetical protein K435DRAFT_642265 [Dendrothele bispora CBS 962.96]|uniref:RNA helicase n=1 Tax=Dendrothele bispora (strain CBS 962.96) TaxID=1314807 RepID=A0A4S8MXK9_DENBC|nr:hypothetical protein K435DRAFT_642265 [Dendrothele bispora CBS 962.96]